MEPQTKKNVLPVNPKLIVGIVTAVLVGVGGHAGYTVTQNGKHSERIAVLESELRAVRGDLAKISDKLDRLVERLRSP